MISCYSFFSIVGLWHHAMKYCSKLWLLKSIKRMPYHLGLPVYCHVPIMHSHKYCSQLTWHHLQFKTWKHLCSFASTVSSGIEPCIMPPFDSDAFIIGVDKHASRCMDSNMNHFTNVQRPKNVTFTKGIGDGLATKAFGMVHWHLQGHQGYLHHIAIHDAAWVPGLPHSLLSLQHWSQ